MEIYRLLGVGACLNVIIYVFGHVAWIAGPWCDDRAIGPTFCDKKKNSLKKNHHKPLHNAGPMERVNFFFEIHMETGQLHCC